MVGPGGRTAKRRIAKQSEWVVGSATRRWDRKVPSDVLDKHSLTTTILQRLAQLPEKKDYGNPRMSRPLGRMLVTAGPTHEPIDAVRYLGNRSSGRMGIAIAERAAARGWDVTLALGPTGLTPACTKIRLARFQTSADLRGVLQREFPLCDCLVMAAAVADFTPIGPSAEEKLSRGAGGMTLELRATPDLLAECGASRRADQLLVGFALEPRSRLLESARRKLERKSVDMIVANPLETMESSSVQATLVQRDGAAVNTDGAMEKSAFADWLLDRMDEYLAARHRTGSEGKGRG